MQTFTALRAVRAILSLMSLLIAADSAAAVYRCQNGDGKPVFRDKPCGNVAPTEQPLAMDTSPRTREAAKLARPAAATAAAAVPANAPPLAFRTIPLTNLSGVRRQFESLRPRLTAHLGNPAHALFRDVRALRAEHLGGSDTYICGQVGSRDLDGRPQALEAFFVDHDEIQRGWSDLPAHKRIGAKWYDFRPVTGQCFSQGQILTE